MSLKHEMRFLSMISVTVQSFCSVVFFFGCGIFFSFSRNLTRSLFYYIFNQKILCFFFEQYYVKYGNDID